MDPSKRICLKNLPDNVTKREIAELVRNRTGAQPHSIDLGLDADGNIRRYAHFSCEGAKNVLEVLQNGVVMRDQTVYGCPAKPHFSFALAEARRKREREEAAEKEAMNTQLEAIKIRACERSHGGELSKSKMPKKTAFSVKPKYGLVAAELAKKFREAHQLRHGKAISAKATFDAAHPSPSTTAAAATTKSTAAAGKNGGGGAHRGNGLSGGERPYKTRKLDDKRGAKTAKRAGGQSDRKGTAASAPSSSPPPPPSPPPPTKEEKKLSGLQARLAALKEKLKKN